MGNLKRTVAIDSVSVRSVDDNGFLHVEKSPLTRVQVAPYYGQEIAGWRELGLDPEKIYHAYRPPEELSSPETIQLTVSRFILSTTMIAEPPRTNKLGSELPERTELLRLRF
mgnify:CR=1 FL=1